MNTTKELKNLLKEINSDLKEGNTSAIHALTAFNGILSSENVYDVFDKDCKQVANEIWKSLEKAGMQIDKPEILN